ncbi:MAG: hypothetical protein LBM98_06645 [Oscillospiraceae bacterium]|nr:hypothetical protein [Oscillospiraceae bacterium]
MRSAFPRHCEAPVSVRYVHCYRREAIQCRNSQIRFFGFYYWIASHL